MTAATLLIFAVCLGAAVQAQVPVDTLLRNFKQKIDHQLAIGAPTKYPSSTAADKTSGHFVWQTSEGWTAGFFPGMLWQYANYTSNASLSDVAASYTTGLAHEANDTGTHDVGFMIFLSFGLGATLDQRMQEYTPTILQAARSLAKRYNPVVGMTRSWGSISDNKTFEVIIDNLINLELLLWSAEQPDGQSVWRDMAISHADRTAEWWIRPDGSTFHLVIFDPITGAVINRSGTPQGYAVNSTWARGQAWGIYGFVMVHRYTGFARYLDYAEKLISYWMAHVPADGVPLWDFDAPPSQPYRDSSSAAIVASALIELDKVAPGRGHFAQATHILSSLSSTYLGGSISDAVLIQNCHDCGSVDCTVIETDYYFLEAILRYSRQHVKTSTL